MGINPYKLYNLYPKASTKNVMLLFQAESNLDYSLSQNQNQSNNSDQSQKSGNNPKDQTEFEANTCNRCQARENACERGTVWF